MDINQLIRQVMQGVPLTTDQASQYQSIIGAATPTTAVAAPTATAAPTQQQTAGNVPASTDYLNAYGKLDSGNLTSNDLNTLLNYSRSLGGPFATQGNTFSSVGNKSGDDVVARMKRANEWKWSPEGRAAEQGPGGPDSVYMNPYGSDFSTMFVPTPEGGVRRVQIGYEGEKGLSSNTTGNFGSWQEMAKDAQKTSLDEKLMGLGLAAMFAYGAPMMMDSIAGIGAAGGSSGLGAVNSFDTGAMGNALGYTSPGMSTAASAAAAPKGGLQSYVQNYVNNLPTNLGKQAVQQALTTGNIDPSKLAQGSVTGLVSGGVGNEAAGLTGDPAGMLGKVVGSTASGLTNAAITGSSVDPLTLAANSAIGNISKTYGLPLDAAKLIYNATKVHG